MRMMEEDPSLEMHRDPQTHELILSGVGQLHIEVVIERLKRKYGAEVELRRRRCRTRRPSRDAPRRRAS